MKTHDEETKEYLKHKGCRCPFCTSSNTETLLDTVSVGETYNDSAHVTRECRSCGSTWIDNFTLTGFDMPLDEDGATF